LARASGPPPSLQDELSENQNPSIGDVPDSLMF
jgi:hypothetical protein